MFQHVYGALLSDGAFNVYVVLSPLYIGVSSYELARTREPWRKTARGLWSRFSPMDIGVVCSNTTYVETN